MKLCVNYLTEVRELLEEGKLDFIDYLKLYSINNDLSPFDWCASKKKVMFHGMVGNLSNLITKDFLKGRDVELQKLYYKKGNTPYISGHINIDRDGEIDEKESEELLKNNINSIKETFDMKVIIENVPASRDNTKNHFCTYPDYITKVVTENDCGFLFDLSHARVASEVLGIPFNEYVERLPMDRLVEIHLSGCILRKDGSLSANHSKMNEEDYIFLEDAIKKYKTLEVVTLEYGPFLDDELTIECPAVSYERVDEVAKKEVYEQLLRIKNILGK